MNKKQSHYIQLDLMVILLLFIIISLLAIYNAQQLGQYQGQNFVIKQILFYGLGIGFLVLLQFIESEQIQKVSIYIYIFGIILLFLLNISPESIAEQRNNAKRAFTGIPGFTLQPAEFAKLGFILYLATIVNRHKEKFVNPSLKSDFKLVAKIGLITVIPVFFIFQQPDLGTSLVFVFIAGMLIILSGIDWRVLLTLLLTGIAVIAGALTLVLSMPETAQSLGIKAYQIERVKTWFSPEEQVSDDTFQIDRSMSAVGSGQIKGKGIGNLEVHLPEAHTDFIFSVIGESFGFIGSVLVIFVFFMLLYRLVTLGMQSLERNPFGAYFIFGYMSLILIHTFQNIGMTIGIMPVTGIPLLFISYGGSTILSTMMGFGVVYLIAVENSKAQASLFD